MDKNMRAEIVVVADSPWGIARGAQKALQAIDQNEMAGKAAIDKHGVSVEWRVVDVVKATDLSKGSLLGPEAPPPAPNLPDISTMDIEEAKGIVGTASGIAELDYLETFEKSGDRTPGGRKAVLKYIDGRRREFREMEAEKATEKAEKAPKEAKKEA